MCEVYADDYDRCTVWAETAHLARKQHRCNACCGTIMPGTKYQRHFSVIDGYVTSEKVCADCTVVRAAYLAEHRIIGVPSRTEFELRECVGPSRYREHWGDTERKWRSALAGMLQRRRQRWRTLQP